MVPRLIGSIPCEVRDCAGSNGGGGVVKWVVWGLFRSTLCVLSTTIRQAVILRLSNTRNDHGLTDLNEDNALRSFMRVANEVNITTSNDVRRLIEQVNEGLVRNVVRVSRQALTTRHSSCFNGSPQVCRLHDLT